MYLKTISLETKQDGGHKSIVKVDKNVRTGEKLEKWTSSGIYSKKYQMDFLKFFLCAESISAVSQTELLKLMPPELIIDVHHELASHQDVWWCAKSSQLI